jgi:hypothetical protein
MPTTTRKITIINLSFSINTREVGNAGSLPLKQLTVTIVRLFHGDCHRAERPKWPIFRVIENSPWFKKYNLDIRWWWSVTFHSSMRLMNPSIPKLRCSVHLNIHNHDPPSFTKHFIVQR